MATDTQSQRWSSRYGLSIFSYVAIGIVGLTGCRMLLGDASAMFDAIEAGDFTTYAIATGHETITRSSLMYWLTGNDHWTSLWVSTNHDIWLAVMSVVANLWMAWEYWQYASNCVIALDGMPDGLTRIHAMQLRRVFIQCAFIHLGIGVLTWWLPAYWLLVALVGVNARQTRYLNKTKLQMLHVQACIQECEIAGSPQPAESPQAAVQGRLDQARNLLIQRVA